MIRKLTLLFFIGVTSSQSAIAQQIIFDSIIVQSTYSVNRRVVTELGGQARIPKGAPGEYGLLIDHSASAPLIVKHCQDMAALMMTTPNKFAFFMDYSLSGEGLGIVQKCTINIKPVPAPPKK